MTRTNSFEGDNRLRSADILVRFLAAQGAEYVYGVPGESYLAVLDAFLDYPQIKFINCRHEGNAAMAAEADGKLTGKPGICFVTRGPGATNAASGVHVAYQDSTPMILFIGQVRRHETGREAFQEIDYTKMFNGVAKWAVEIRDENRMEEILGRAYQVAMSGRPGPVVVALPEDMLRAKANCEQIPHEIKPPVPHPDPDALAQLFEELNKAKSPVLVVGGSGWSKSCQMMLEEFATRWKIPVACAFRTQDRMNNEHPCYVGHLSVGRTDYLYDFIDKCDLLIVLGDRLGEIVTGGYSLIKPPKIRQKLVHIYPDESELGRTYQPDIAIVSSVSTALEALLKQGNPNHPLIWESSTQEIRKEFVAFSSLQETSRLSLAECVRLARQRLPKEAIITNGAGNYAVWVHRFFSLPGYLTQLSPMSGTMGYGVPAALAAKLRHPNIPVVAFAGDGCFMMSCQEFSTAVEYGAPIVCVVVNNGRYGTIRTHQERQYPARISGTNIGNMDFVAFAKACGGEGVRVEKTEQFDKALKFCLEANVPSLIELVQDPDVLAPGVTIESLRAKLV